MDKDGNKKEPMKQALKQKKVQEVAPPGAKAERMVKHIKKGYAKDGKVTPKEKSIAYATAWKAHNKGKVEEAIRAMFEAGYTKEQIVEGWEDMLKSVEKSRRDEKGTGKFDKKKSDKGNVYTRKYNPKSGESDDSENVTKEKRGRGRPKKSAFESKYSTVSKMITESFLKEQSTAPIAPADREKFMKSSDPQAFNKLTGASDKADATGTIKRGTWQADKPKAGEKAVPVPQNPEVAKEDAELEEMKRLAGFQVNECGVSPMGNGMMGQEAAGKMNISTNMSSDGNKSVTITADGDAALELMQMLKLAGMQGGEAPQQQEPEGVMVVSTDDEEEVDENLVAVANPAGAASADQAKQIGAKYPQQGGQEPDLFKQPGANAPASAGTQTDEEEEVDEAKDERYHASTTPDEHVEPVQSQTKGGNGDVAGQEKRMRKGGYQFGDNNLAMKEVSEGIAGLEAMGRKLYKEYESIKVQK